LVFRLVVGLPAQKTLYLERLRAQVGLPSPLLPKLPERQGLPSHRGLEPEAVAAGCSVPAEEWLAAEPQIALAVLHFL
jgi:hypothetical protein